MTNVIKPFETWNTHFLGLICQYSVSQFYKSAPVNLSSDFIANHFVFPTCPTEANLISPPEISIVFCSFGNWIEWRCIDVSVFFKCFSHINKKTTYTDPRLAFAIEDRLERKGGLKQRFDASSTAQQVLLGRDLTNQFVIVTGGNSGIGCNIFFLYLGTQTAND